MKYTTRIVIITCLLPVLAWAQDEQQAPASPVLVEQAQRDTFSATLWVSGTVIARKGSGVAEAITVRRVSYGEGVERVFPLSSPNIDKIEIERHGKVRRAKLYYLRDLAGKKARIKERRV